MHYFEIPIKPVAWQRARRKGKVYFDDQVEEKNKLRWHVKLAGRSICAASTALKVVAQYEIPMPPSWSARKREMMRGKPHTQTPDTDNLLKFIGDSLNRILWEDDKLIYEFTGRKVWADEPKICFTIEEYFDEPLPTLFNRDKELQHQGPNL